MYKLPLVMAIKEDKNSNTIIKRYEESQFEEALEILKDIVKHSKGTKGALYLDLPQSDKPKLLKRVRKNVFGKVIAV